MREKLKPFKILIVGILVITAFVRGISMYIALAVFFGVYLVYLVVKPILKKRNPKAKTNKTVNKYRRSNALNHVRMFGFGRMIENAVNKIIR